MSFDHHDMASLSAVVTGSELVIKLPLRVAHSLGWLDVGAKPLAFMEVDGMLVVAAVPPPESEHKIDTPEPLGRPVG